MVKQAENFFSLFAPLISFPVCVWNNSLWNFRSATLWGKLTGCLLFCRVIELVFVTSTKARLNSVIRPKPFHGCQKFFAKGLRVFHPLYNVEDHFCVRLEHSSRVRVFQLSFSRLFFISFTWGIRCFGVFFHTFGNIYLVLCSRWFIFEGH